jgi:hypothetical protein
LPPQRQAQQAGRKQHKLRTLPEVQLLCLDMDGTLLDSNSRLEALDAWHVSGELQILFGFKSFLGSGWGGPFRGF